MDNKVNNHGKNSCGVYRCHSKMCGHTKKHKELDKTSWLDEVSKPFSFGVNKDKGLRTKSITLHNWTTEEIRKNFNNLFNSSLFLTEAKITTVINPNSDKEVIKVKNDYTEVEALKLPVSGHSQEFETEATESKEVYIRNIISLEDSTDDLYLISSHLNKACEKIEAYLEKLPEAEGSKMSVRMMAETLGHGFTRLELEYFLAKNTREQETINKLMNKSAVIRLGLCSNDYILEESLEVLACDPNSIVSMNAREVIALNKRG